MQQKSNNLLMYLKSNWPESIRKLGFKTKIINLSKDVVDYIGEDQIFISNHWKGKQENEKCEDENENEKRFPELEKMINDILDEYDQQVFIKLNWWAPKDCENSVLDLCCINMYDIFLMLKSSGLLMEMIDDYKEDWLNNNFPECALIQKSDQLHNGYQLEIRKWYKLNKEQEYRCFIYQGELVGISQRNLSQIKNMNKEAQSQLMVRVNEFYESKIRNELGLSSFVLDIYVDLPPRERIILVDINPWREYTNSKLFTWEELENGKKECLIRLVQSKDMIVHEDYSSYKVPCEFLNAENFDEIIKAAQEQCNEE